MSTNVTGNVAQTSSTPARNGCRTDAEPTATAPVVPPVARLLWYDSGVAAQVQWAHRCRPVPGC